MEVFPASIVLLQNLLSFSVLHYSPVVVGRNLATMDVSNLQTSYVVVVAVDIAFVDAIVPLSNTHQVISLKLTNKNYLY